jgi:hypothetical protein
MIPFSPKATPAQRQKAVADLIATLKADTKPILLGPWRSEVGFEALYWLPFLRHLAKHVPGFDQRAAVVTRGGLAPLYKAVSSQGFDLYALRTVQELRRENLFDRQQTGKSKQMAPTTWDEDVLADAAHELKIGALYHTVHPAWMYWALEPFWNEAMGLRYLLSLTDFTPLAPPSLPAELPPAFVAVKFYARATFPYPHPDVAEFVQRTVTTLASQTQVVLLNSRSEFDDHADIACAGTNVHQLPDDVSPDENLLVQAAVLSKATAFVGTYGGVAQLALRMGVPSVSFYHDFEGTAHAHLALSSWLSKKASVPFLAGSMADSVLWAQVVGGVTVKREAVAA